MKRPQSRPGGCWRRARSRPRTRRGGDTCRTDRCGRPKEGRARSGHCHNDGFGVLFCGAFRRTCTVWSVTTCAGLGIRGHTHCPSIAVPAKGSQPPPSPGQRRWSKTYQELTGPRGRLGEPLTLPSQPQCGTVGIKPRTLLTVLVAVAVSPKYLFRRRVPRQCLSAGISTSTVWTDLLQ